MSQKLVNGVTGIDLDVNDENHGNQNGENDDRVDVTGQKGRLKTTRGSVQNDTPGDQERSKTVIDTGQGFDGGGATQQKHRCNDDIGTETKEKECLVGCQSPASVDDFTNCMGRGSNLLQLDGKNSKQQNLDSRTRCIPGTSITKNEEAQRGTVVRKSFRFPTTFMAEFLPKQKRTRKVQKHHIAMQR